MPVYQLETAIFLAVCSALSFVIFLFSRPRHGKIQLPVDGDEPLTHDDPFDVSKPEDAIDGYPIEEEAFWRKMKWRKIFLSALLFAIVTLEAVSLGWSIITEETNHIIIYSLRLAFALYVLSMSLRSVGLTTIGENSESLVHIATLSLLAVFSLGIAAMLPSNLSYSEDGVGDSTSALLVKFWYSVTVLYILACFLSARLPHGPPLHYPPNLIYSEKTIAASANIQQDNVCGITVASIWDTLFFSYTTNVVMLSNKSESLEIGDLPIVPKNMRAANLFGNMTRTLRTVKLKIRSWRPVSGSGWELGWRLIRVNALVLTVEILLAAVSAVLFYTPAFFLLRVVRYLENDPDRTNRGWGWVWVTGLFLANVIQYIVTGQLWSVSTTIVQPRLRIQLNSILYAKTLVRKDLASSSTKTSEQKDANEEKKDDNEDDFSSKSQVMTLMTTDVDRVSEFAWHLFSLVDAPIEVAIGTFFLYQLLGVSCFFGLGVTCLFLPLNHFAGKVVVKCQDNLMKARDERVSLMNEILGGIRMLKFMAWERSFEARVLKIRNRELKYQRLNYTIETLWNAIWNGSPILVTLVTFWHFTIIRHQALTPSIAFTSISIFNEMKFALNALPETFINMLQSLVSMRRIEKYLNGAEVDHISTLANASTSETVIALQSATVTWPQDRPQVSNAPSAASTPKQKFVLLDLSLNFPIGELSLICGKLGSGKTLLLLSLLGEADLLTGQIICPRSPPDALAKFTELKNINPKDWIVPGVCAYVPQAAWLRNASIKDNILFNLPLDEERYQKTLEACALLSDLEILEDGDESEIGERGVNLSGGQKARVSLARAVYSRASILFLDDVLSAVDAHTAHHLYHNCLQGDLMKGRTVILVSHHVQLCAPGASYIVALDNGKVAFSGDNTAFQNSAVKSNLVLSEFAAKEDEDTKEEAAIEEVLDEREKEEATPASETSSISASAQSSTAAPTVTTDAKEEKKKPRKLVEEEKRAVGRISRDIWETYIWACGQKAYWTIFLLILLIATMAPVAENFWLKMWSAAQQANDDETKSPGYYIGFYAMITVIGLIITTLRWFVLYHGSITASTVLYQRLLEAVLFAKIRFHDTVNRGRLLNRFGKDFEGIDSSLSDNLGRSIMYGLSGLTTFIVVSASGGLSFVFAALVLAFLYYQVGKVYGQTSRDMRRLDSVTRSPLYSIYGETISGVAILRAFGASSKFLRDMLCCVDTNSNPYYWMWGVNRWLSARFTMLSSAVVGLTALIAILTPSISASLAGFALAFASTITGDLLFMVRRFVGLEMSMVALERVKEYSELAREPPEFVEPRPPLSWPSTGEIECKELVIRYAPDLPDVLHKLSFNIRPREKVGILGRTGSGKSTLALSFFRFVEATEGSIFIDGIDISKIGLTDLRSKLTIIPQDPTILSGTLRSTLDVFDEYTDADIFAALRRVHLIPSEDAPEETLETVNANVFRNLDSSVSEGGENFSTGEKQLLCMARAILKRSKVLVMDEATASVDYATDELISKTIQTEFADSTILTIAHRLRTVINYDRVMLLDNGRIAEFDRPASLLANKNSLFYALCKATGKQEFATLRQMASARAGSESK